MRIFRKSLSVVLAVLIALQAGAFTVSGESAEDEKAKSPTLRCVRLCDVISASGGTSG